MARDRKQSGTERKPSLVRRGIELVVCASVFIIPLAVSLNGRDSFRLPKEIVLRAEFIAIIALVAIGLVYGEIHWSRLRWKHPVIVITVALVAWCAIATASSTNLALSVPSLLLVAGMAVVFVTTLVVARSRPLGMLRWVFWPGIINALLYLAVALRLTPNPLAIDSRREGISAATGLLGNANDVGAVLLPIAVCATAAALASRRHRIMFTTTAVLCGTTVLISVSVAAIGAMLVALATLGFVWSWRRALLVTLAVATAGALLLIAHAPLQQRLIQMIEAAQAARWDDVSNGRMTAVFAAAEMFRDHPVTGVGLGTFGWQYYPYKLEVSDRHPDILNASAASRFNFEEAHNDHMEVLAETGAPGYLLFLGSLALLGSGSLRRRSDIGDVTETAAFARLAQLPLAVALGVVGLAQYPLQLASSISVLVFLAALLTAWREDLEPVIPGGE